MYLIRKGSLWLLNYRPSGCCEITVSGKLEEIYTCLWGERMRDAKAFEKDYDAKYLAKKIGGTVVRIAEKGESK